jgi:hypothetical protein
MSIAKPITMLEIFIFIILVSFTFDIMRLYFQNNLFTNMAKWFYILFYYPHSGYVVTFSIVVYRF